MMHAVVTGTPLKQKVSGKDCWSFEIVLIEALGRQWDYTSEYEMTLSGVFWEVEFMNKRGIDEGE